MANHRHRRRKKYYVKSSWLKWSELKLYLGIGVLCFVLAGGINYVVTRGSAVVDRVNNLASMAEQLPEGAVLDQLMNLKEDGGLEAGQINDILTGNSGQLGDLIKGGGGNLSNQDINKAKQDYKANLSQDQIETLKNAYKQYKGQ